jgi:actin
VTWIVPIYEGHIIPHGVRRLDIGGSDITEYLLKLLRHGGLPVENTRAERDIIRDVKELLAFISIDYDGDMKRYEDEKQQQSSKPSAAVWPITDVESNINNYTAHQLAAASSPFIHQQYKSFQALVPPSYGIVLGSERFQCAELYFTPSLLITDSKVADPSTPATATAAAFTHDDNKTLLHGGIHHLICESIAKCDGDIRSELYGNIVLSGCSSQLPGFATRLTQELNQLLRATSDASPTSTTTATGSAGSTVNGNGEEVKSSLSQVVRAPNSNDAACNGAAYLTSLPSMSSLWITKQEYEEFGSTIVHRRCI